MKKIEFNKRKTIEQVEEGEEFAPKFNSKKLIPVVTTDYQTGEVLMQGYMSEEALKMTLKLKEAVYFSRSRKILWHKGKMSGFVQKVREIRIDDDQDCLWLRVDVVGKASCHVGYRSCFYRSVKLEEEKDHYKIFLKFEEKEKVFDPNKIYPTAENPTIL